MSVRSFLPGVRRASLPLRLLVILSLSFGAARPQAPQNKDARKNPDEEVVTVRSHLVNVDVSVKDGKGNYVNDLRAEDFTVFENGVRQKVEFFNPPLAGTSRAAGETATHADGPTPLAQRGMPRNIISLVLDGQTTEQQNLKPLREGTLKYIRERIAETDSVALFNVTAGLQLLQPFTSDKAKLLSAAENAFNSAASSKTTERSGIAEGVGQRQVELDSLRIAEGRDPVADSGARGAKLQAMVARRALEQFTMLRAQLSLQQSRPILAALAAICEAQRDVPGKKTLVLFSEGFITSATQDWQVQSIIDLANRANVAIYIIDAAGLRGGAPQTGSYIPTNPLDSVSVLSSIESGMKAQAGENEFDNVRHEGKTREYDILYRISGDTGGKFIKGTNDIAKGLDRIDEEIRARYTLAYQSTDTNFDGSFRKLKIEVARPDSQVIARSGYYAIAPEQIVPLSPEDKKLLANVTSPETSSSLPLFVELSPFRAREGRYVIPLALEVPHDAVKFEPRADKQRMQLDVLVVVREGKDNILSRLGGSFDVLLNDAQYQSILNNNVFYRQDMELAPGAYNVDMVVRDRLSGKIAARREKLVLPEAGPDFSMTDAVLSRHVEPARQTGLLASGDVLSQGGALISPLPSREFRAADNLIIFFDLYNAAPNTETGKPAVKVTVTLLKDGKAALKPIGYELTESVSEPVPHLTFAKYITLTGLPAGEYTAVVEATDSVARKLLKQQAAFVITK